MNYLTVKNNLYSCIGTLNIVLYIMTSILYLHIERFILDVSHDRFYIHLVFVLYIEIYHLKYNKSKFVKIPNACPSIVQNLLIFFIEFYVYLVNIKGGFSFRYIQIIRRICNTETFDPNYVFVVVSYLFIQLHAIRLYLNDKI